MKRGNIWYNKLKEHLESQGFTVEPMFKYPFAHVFYRSGMYKHRIDTIPMKLTPFNYKENWGKINVSTQSGYEKYQEVGRAKIASTRLDTVPGYYYLKEQLKRRFYMLRNSLDFNQALLQNTKNRLRV